MLKNLPLKILNLIFSLTLFYLTAFPSTINLIKLMQKFIPFENQTKAAGKWLSHFSDNHITAESCLNVCTTYWLGKPYRPKIQNVKWIFNDNLHKFSYLWFFFLYFFLFSFLDESSQMCQFKHAVIKHRDMDTCKHDKNVFFWG